MLTLCSFHCTHTTHIVFPHYIHCTMLAVLILRSQQLHAAPVPDESPTDDAAPAPVSQLQTPGATSADAHSSVQSSGTASSSPKSAASNRRCSNHWEPCPAATLEQAAEAATARIERCSHCAHSTAHTICTARVLLHQLHTTCTRRGNTIMLLRLQDFTVRSVIGSHPLPDLHLRKAISPA